MAPSDSATAPALQLTWRERLGEFVMHRRVALSILLFGSLLIEDLYSKVVPHDLFDFRDPKTVAGLLVLLSGLAIRSWAAGFLIKNTQLTTTGPYALVRNPLYLGSFMMVAGFCLLIDDRENLWILPLALFALYLPKVRAEERGLSGRYPEAWRDYAARTPRFLPRALAWPCLAGWQFSQWMRSREYKAVGATFAALIGLKLLRDYYLS